MTVKQLAAQYHARDTQRIKELERELDRITRAHQYLQQVDIGHVQPATVTASRKTGKSESVAVALLSDIHAFEPVNPRTVGNRNRYNPDICRARINHFCESIVMLTGIERHATTIDTLVLGLLGDVISGHIHEELAEKNHGSPIEEGRFVVGLIKGALDYLSKHFTKIIVPCCVGNHGRDTETMRVATAWAHSYEAWIYAELAEQYKHVQFLVEPSYFQYVNVYGKVLRFSHGDAVRYQGGILGPAVPLSKKIANWNSARYADLDLMGHLHFYQPSDRYILNGSVIGYGPYSQKIGAPYQPPIQAFLTIERDHWITSIRPIYLEV